MNVLSLFDGMSCGQQALERAGIKVNNYYASEIDKHAIQITQKNYPNTIQLGSVVNVDVHTLGKIDLLIGGSPCQSFSFAGKRKGMSTKDEIEILSLDQYLELKEQNFEFEGQSYLFWEYMRILTDLRKLNPNVKFLLENVIMGEKWEKVLSKAIGVNGIKINSSLVSAQNRRRLYWTNIGMKPAGLFGDLESVISQPKDKGILLKDILESEVDEKYFLSDKMIASFQSHEERHKEKGTGFFWKPTDGDVKGNCLRANGALAPTDNIIIHNLMPRSSTNGNGGSGHLTRNDGKTYCLDTANSIAVEVREVRQLNKNNQSNNNTQPYQQNRVYDIEGITPALCAHKSDLIINTSRIRRLTPTECERLQTVKDGYTEGVSDTQRYRMLGNGWTVEVIAHIFNYLNN
jgi:DNA (cytosine-5)-methyltransferase 3A